MKRRITAVIAVIIAMLGMMAVNASACRQGPIHDGSCIDFYTDAGEVTLGKTETVITGKECKIFKFIPEKDGFYLLSYLDDGCVFCEEKTDEYGESWTLRAYMGTCDYDYESEDYRHTEIYKFRAGEVCSLYVMSPITYMNESLEAKQSFELSYLGEIKDFDVSAQSKGNVYDIERDGFLDSWEDEDGQIHQYIYPTYDVEFTNGETFCNLDRDASNCGGLTTEIEGDFVPVEGINKVTVDLYGVKKEIRIKCQYSAESFIDIHYCRDIGEAVETMFRNFSTGMRVMFGFSDIGSPKLLLGIRIIACAVMNLFRNINSMILNSMLRKFFGNI